MAEQHRSGRGDGHEQADAQASTASCGEQPSERAGHEGPCPSREPEGEDDQRQDLEASPLEDQARCPE